MKQNYVVSYGAGIDSTAMILRLIDEKKPIDHVVFSDTGGELKETYAYIDYFKKKVLDQNSIPFTMVFPHKFRSLYERCISRKVTPDKFRRWCTRDTKVKPIHKFYTKTLKSFIHEYMGIDAGETKRVKVAKEPFIKKHYPLVDWGMDRDDCIKYIQDANLLVPLKSGCFFCPFNSNKRWKEIDALDPDYTRKSKLLSENSKHFPKLKLADFDFDDIQNIDVSEHDDYCNNGYV